MMATSGESARAEPAAGHITGVGGVFFKAKDPKALAACGVAGRESGKPRQCGRLNVLAQPCASAQAPAAARFRTARAI